MTHEASQPKERFRLRFAIHLAFRESRYGFKRVGVFMGSIALGVAALVSVHSFRADVARSVQDEADVLMGGNARFSNDQPIPPNVVAFVDSFFLTNRNSMNESDLRLNLVSVV